jgi:Pyridoxamine 5'-phosphate oxidase
MTDAARTGAERAADAVRQLGAVGADTWVATASPSGVAHLVPLSYSWDGRDVLIAAPAASLTVRNIRASGRARLAFGATRDVLMVDARLEAEVPLADAPASLADGYVRQADWDPREESDPYVFLRLRPIRVQAWREANELAGRTIMQDGDWLF